MPTVAITWSDPVATHRIASAWEPDGPLVHTAPCTIAKNGNNAAMDRAIRVPVARAVCEFMVKARAAQAANTASFNPIGAPIITGRRKAAYTAGNKRRTVRPPV
jgi:hypothetical protein